MSLRRHPIRPVGLPRGMVVLPGIAVNEKTRFEVELEFLQCLASPEYLHFLAQNRYLEDPAFLAFLKYLEYWRDPAYAQFITYPHCLAMLDCLLTSERFRKELLMTGFRDFVHQQQFNAWRHMHTLQKTGHRPTEGAGSAPQKG